jgi:hypothetical protein
VVSGLNRVAAALEGVGEAAVRTGLLQWRASLECEPESAGVLRACGINVTGPEENVTETVAWPAFSSQ